MGNEILSPLKALVVFLGIAIIPFIFIPATGLPELDTPSSIVVTILVGFLFGVYDRKFLRDNFMAFVWGCILYAILLIALDLRWFAVMLILLGSYLLGRNMVERRADGHLFKVSSD